MYESYIKHIKEYREIDTTIERIDNNGNYCKENCTRATRKEQANNRSDMRILEYNGEKHNVSQRAVKLGIKRRIIYGRLREGRSTEEALRTTMNKYRHIRNKKNLDNN